MPGQERRWASFYADASIEVRAETDDERIISGHAAVFNSLSKPIFDFKEEIAPGAFRDTIKTDDIRALFNHDPSFILGRNRAGTLELSEDNVGLADTIHLPDTTAGRDIMESVRRGDISDQSFGFWVVREEWTEPKPDDGQPFAIRRVLEARLGDVSPVTFPAYLNTDLKAARADNAYVGAAVKRYEEWRDSLDKRAKARIDHINRKRRLKLLEVD